MEEDPRFAHVASDPRFKRMPRKEKKVKIDERFQKMFTDKNFTVNYFVDKRGSKVKNTSKEDLDKFYSLSDESEEEDEEAEEEEHVEEYEDVKEIKKKEKVAKSKSKLKIEKSQKDKEKLKKSEVNLETPSSDEESENDRHFKMDDKSLEVENDDVKGDDDDDDSSEEELDISRGEGILESSSDEEELDFGMVQNEMEHPWGEMHTAAKTTEEATRRLAVCNLDWDRVTAMDLFVLFSSFRPRDGIIEAVKIYPSEYGLEQMKTEDSLGPVQLKDDEDDENKNSHNKEALEGAEYSSEKLRQYQLNRLKYYYAVMECDSPETAEVLYDGCDGKEFELSGNVLDLRYIPDDVEFNHEPHSVATDLPAAGTYTVPDFYTTALHHSKVKLTWDETDPRRHRTTMRKFSKEDLLDMDFDAYLASSSDEEETKENDGNLDEEQGSDEDEEKKINKYKQLLKEIEDKESKNDGEQDLEITWEPGLQETTEELVKNKLKEKEGKNITPWEHYLQKRKQKKKEKRMQKESLKKQNDSEESEDIPSDVDLSDPYFREEIDAGLSNVNNKGSAKTSKKRKWEVEETEEDKKAKEELELLLMDDKDDKHHFSLKGIMDNEKKTKKQKKRKEKEIVNDDFNVDLKDSRFDALFTSHHFAVDPSDPQYRKTKGMESILQERMRRRENGEKLLQANKNKDEGTQRRDPSLSVLVKSVKSKAGQFHEKKVKKRLIKS
ncbi:ESF1 homolog [Acropora palmata]|uniref:ESF1 homolog n=1 Tax=Acropora palmata TaxID=6131 RepID=UPI003DA099D5